MFDCTKTEDLITVLEKMCESVSCDSCPIDRIKAVRCADLFKMRNIAQAVKILQEWAYENLDKEGDYKGDT